MGVPCDSLYRSIVTYHTALGLNNSAGSRLPILKKSDMVWPKRRSFPFDRLVVVASSNCCCLHLPLFSLSSSLLLFFSSSLTTLLSKAFGYSTAIARVFVIDSTKAINSLVSTYVTYESLRHL